MKRARSNILWVAFLATCMLLIFVAPANAYLDPGSGSIIFQAVVGGAMAVGLGIKLFWRRIVSFFSRKH
ncbi:MAG: hypothetical protein ACR2KQ_12265 [Actinomycetota bacterium]